MDSIKGLKLLGLYYLFPPSRSTGNTPYRALSVYDIGYMPHPCSDRYTVESVYQPVTNNPGSSDPYCLNGRAPGTLPVHVMILHLSRGKGEYLGLWRG